MMEVLYHGSITPGITELEARSRLHNTDKQVVYLTNSVPYALFYVWNSTRNGYSSKYVTGGFRDGLAFYEEQFPDQLKTFYQGVSGYLYRLPFSADVQAVAHRDGLFYHLGNTAVTGVEFIPDVYETLLHYEAAGQLKVLRYNEQTDARKAELTDLIATAILRSNFYQDNEEQQQFMKKHFASAWRKAYEQRS